MSIIDTLITDRTAADVTALKQLMALDYASMSPAQQAAWLQDSKGAYNVSDMNRVGTALNYLKQLVYQQSVEHRPESALKSECLDKTSRL